MLELRNINFCAGDRQILKDINLKIDSGKFIAITGPNGSGKSTLAKIIMGIEKPDSGQILFDGHDITDIPVNQRANMGISFGFQQPVKFKGITIHDLLNLSAKRQLKCDEACDLLATVGLCANSYLDREVNGSLSGGELKRIEIASVLARGSRLTIFDEPEAGIDLWSFQNLIKVFNDMQTSLNGSIIVISHQERILNIADDIILLADGSIQKVVHSVEDLGDIMLSMQDRLTTCRKI